MLRNTPVGGAKPGFVFMDEMTLFAFADFRIHFRKLKTGIGVWELSEQTSKLKLMSL